MAFILTQEGYLQVLALSGIEALLDHGTITGLADDDHTQYILHSLATAANDFLVASGSGTFVKKTLAEVGAILEADLDHGSIQGLTDDDHTQYILVTDLEADRATVNSYWEDLTDGGATALHSHAGGSGDLKADGTVPMTADWPFGNFALYIGDSANANMTIGLTINQGAADDQILAFKSSDISHSGYNGVEADTYGLFRKRSGDEGGLQIFAYKDANTDARGSLHLTGIVDGDVPVIKGEGGYGASVEIWGLKANAGAIANQTSDGNIVSMSTYIADNWRCRWHLDEDGDTWQAGSLTLGSRLLTETDLTDLLDGGVTALHSHAAGGGDLKADGTVPMTADWPFGNFALYIGDTVNAKMTIGLTINQGANDDETIALKSSDVGHDFAAYTETDTFCTIAKYSGDLGGVQITGYSETYTGLRLHSRVMTEDASPDFGTLPTILMSCQLTDGGGGLQAQSNDACLMAVRNHSTNQWMVVGDGRTFQPGSLFVGNEFVNTKMTIGVTINQAANDDEIIALKSSDVDHDMTSLTETDTFGTMAKYLGADGGLHICGYSDIICGLRFSGRAMSEDTGPDFGQLPTILMSCQLSNGGGSVTTQGDDACLMAVRNHTANKWMCQGDGRTFQAGGLFINEFANTYNTMGLTINQGTLSNEAISLKSSDVDHPMTSLSETDTYGVFKKYTDADGGLQIEGYTDATVALRVYARVVTEDSTKAHESTAAIMLAGSLAAGSSAGAMSANANIVLIRNYTGAKWICDSDGDTWQPGGGTFGGRCIGVNSETIPEVDIDDAAPGTTYPGIIWVDTS